MPVKPEVPVLAIANAKRPNGSSFAGQTGLLADGRSQFSLTCGRASIEPLSSLLFANRFPSLYNLTSQVLSSLSWQTPESDLGTESSLLLLPYRNVARLNDSTRPRKPPITS